MPKIKTLPRISTSIPARTECAVDRDCLHQ